ncbi:MAG TPA: TetR/AcrR family transcriptional regulator [Mycobacterium sp.]|jgi:AcrR family transcriptional regulator
MTVVNVAAPIDPDAAAHPFRRRLLDGLAQSIAQRGYRETTIADIVRHARTSKRTFYQEFSSKEECFVELLRTSNEEMVSHIVAAVDPEAFWQEQIRQAIDAYVDVIESRPAIMLSWIRELPALGAVVRSVQRQGIEQFIDMMVGISSNPGFGRDNVPPASRQMALILVGGLRELAALTVEDDRDVREIVDTAVAASIALVVAGAQ